MPQSYSATALLRNCGAGSSRFALLTERVLFASLTDREGT